MAYKNPAIVIGGGHNGLGVMRNLGRNGIDTYCLVDNPNNFAIYSRYCKGYFVVDGFERDREVLRKCLTSIARRFSNKVYVHPTSDLSVLNLSQIIDELDTCVASIPSREAAETLVIKKNFYKSLQDKGVPHPLTLFSDEEDVEVICRKLPFPVFIKPSISQTFFVNFIKRVLSHITRNNYNTF